MHNRRYETADWPAVLALLAWVRQSKAVMVAADAAGEVVASLPVTCRHRQQSGDLNAVVMSSPCWRSRRAEGGVRAALRSDRASPDPVEAVQEPHGWLGLCEWLRPDG